MGRKSTTWQTASQITYISVWRTLCLPGRYSVFPTTNPGWTPGSKTLPLCSCVDSKSTYFAYWWRHRPTSRPLAFDLLTPCCQQRMMDYMLVFVLQKILNRSGLLGQNYAPLTLRWAKKGRPTSHFHLLRVVLGFSFHCLFVYSAQALCTCSVASSPFFLWISSATYRPGIWTTACWVIFSGSVWMQIFLKRCQGRRGGKKIVLVRVDMALLWSESLSCGKLPVWSQFQSLCTPRSLATSTLLP